MPADRAPTLSICIPSYNRPEKLDALLRSVPTGRLDLEIVVCEDHAPRREEVRAVVQRFSKETVHPVRYFENEKNLGYDKNIRELISKARGTYVMFMGDDDRVATENLEGFIELLAGNPDIGYVLRTYENVHASGTVEMFRYFKESRRFEAGADSYVALFRKSVSVSGFTFRREWGLEFLTDRFDGHLLFQLYLMAEIVLRHPAFFYDVPIVRTHQTWREDNQNFGSSEAEKGKFKPGKVSFENSVNFMKGFFVITEYMDRTYDLRSTEAIRTDISRYSYPVLSIQRKRGVREFLRYVGMLNREVKINNTPYFALYVVALTVLGEENCDRTIRGIKKVMGRTPALG